jgi:hypothetical protein
MNTSHEIILQFYTFLFFMRKQKGAPAFAGPLSAQARKKMPACFYSPAPARFSQQKQCGQHQARQGRRGLEKVLHNRSPFL